MQALRRRLVPGPSVVIWLLPIVAALVVRKLDGRLEKPLVVLVGLAFVLLASRRPERCVTALVVGLPFTTFALAFLFGSGVPAGLVRELTFWKEGLVAAVVVAGYRTARREHHRLDTLDVVALLYLFIGFLYYATPRWFIPADFPIPSAYVRELGLREDGLFVILFLAARHARLDRQWAERVTRWVLGTGTVVALIAIYEFSFTKSWNNIAIHDFHVIAYQIQVVKTTVISFTDVEVHSTAGNQSIIRVGSVLLSPLSLGFWLLMPLGVGVERIARGTARLGTVLAVGVVGAALILTQTRSAILAGLIVVLLATRPAPGRMPGTRVRFGLVALGLVILSLPLVLGSGLGSRTASATNGTDTSANDHVHSFYTGLDAIFIAPLGHGIGTGPAIGQRFTVFGELTPENYYLQIGLELGFAGMLVFLLFTIIALRRLGAAQRDGPGATFLSATRITGFGLAIGCLFLHVWIDVVTALSYWALAGAALGIGEVLPRVPSAGSRPSTPAVPGGPEPEVTELGPATLSGA